MIENGYFKREVTFERAKTFLFEKQRAAIAATAIWSAMADIQENLEYWSDKRPDSYTPEALSEEAELLASNAAFKADLEQLASAPFRNVA